MSYSNESAQAAATLKLGRTIWLIPLILIANWICNKQIKATRFPIFILFFMAAIFTNSILNLNGEITNLLQILSQAFLLIGLFCIGSQFDPNEMKSISSKPLIMALIIWAVVIPSAYALVKYF